MNKEFPQCSPTERFWDVMQEQSSFARAYMDSRDDIVAGLKALVSELDLEAAIFDTGARDAHAASRPDEKEHCETLANDRREFAKRILKLVNKNVGQQINL